MNFMQISTNLGSFPKLLEILNQKQNLEIKKG
jgi:hypothetical protein